LSGPKEKPVIGLVGGVGSGKSTAAAEFARLGCAVIDADKIGHRLLNDPEVRRELQKRWGDAIVRPDGRIDRAALGKIVFADRSQLEALNAIMHPRMEARIHELIRRYREAPEVPAVVLDAAVLFEAGWDKLCSDTVFISAPEHLRTERISRRRGWDADQRRARENAQIPLDSKAAKCDHTIDNSSTVPHLRRQVRQLFQQIVHA